MTIADAEGLDDCTTTAEAAARAYRLAADMIEEEA